MLGFRGNEIRSLWLPVSSTFATRTEKSAISFRRTNICTFFQTGLWRPRAVLPTLLLLIWAGPILRTQEGTISRPPALAPVAGPEDRRGTRALQAVGGLAAVVRPAVPDQVVGGVAAVQGAVGAEGERA